MKIWRNALILGVVTESATVAGFIVARGSNDDLPARILVILHYPAIFLNFIGAPWLLAVLIETAVWVLVWFLLFQVFAPPRDELTVLSFSYPPGEGQESQVKKIVPR